MKVEFYFPPLRTQMPKAYGKLTVEKETFLDRLFIFLYARWYFKHCTTIPWIVERRENEKRQRRKK